MSRDSRGKVLGEGGFDFDSLAERHAAGWRFAVMPAGSGDTRDAPCLSVIRSGGNIDFPSLDHELAEVAEGDRVLLLLPPAETRRDARYTLTPAGTGRPRAAGQVATLVPCAHLNT